MPLLGTYTFTEKADKVVVAIPLKGCAPNKVDIFVTSTTLKVNYSPYLLDLVLHSSVDAVKHKATVKEGVLHVTLLKAAPGATWGELVSNITDKKELAAAREAAMAGHTQLQDTLKEARHDRRIDDERHALRKQMALEETERSLLEGLKAEEKTDAEERVYKEFADMERKNALAAASKDAPAVQASKPKKEKEKEKEKDRRDNKPASVLGGSQGLDNDNSLFAHLHETPKTTTFAPPGPSAAVTGAGNSAVNDIFRASDLMDMNAIDDFLAKEGIDEVDDEGEGEGKYSMNDIDEEEEEEEEEEPVRRSPALTAKLAREAQLQQQQQVDDNDIDIKYVPPPRSTGYNEKTRVEVSYTPRVFPTPMRESKGKVEYICVRVRVRVRVRMRVAVVSSKDKLKHASQN